MGFVEIKRVGSETVIRYENGERIVGSQKWCDGHDGFASDIGAMQVPLENSDDTIWFCKECATDGETSLRRSRGEGVL